MTYLEAVNRLLRRLNEPQLEITNFLTAPGLHAYTRDAINSALQDIMTREREFPFNYGNSDLSFTAGTATVALPSGARYARMDTVYLKAGADYSGQALEVIDFEEWHTKYRSEDENTANRAMPRYAYRTPDNRLGVSPVPDETYTVNIEYFTEFAQLDAHDDTIPIPDRYIHVLMDGAMFRLHQMRDNMEMASIVQRDFALGLDRMRAELVNRYEYVRGPTMYHSNYSKYA